MVITSDLRFGVGPGGAGKHQQSTADGVCMQLAATFNFQDLPGRSEGKNAGRSPVATRSRRKRPTGFLRSLCRSRVGMARLSWLSEDRVGDPLPPGRITPPHIGREALSNDQQWQRIEIRLVDALIDQQVARNAEKDQQVQARKEEIMVEQVVK